MDVETLRRIIGKNIKYYRLCKEFSQEEFCEKTNTSVTHLRQIENGKTNISLSKLVDFMKVLNIHNPKLLVDEKILNMKFPNNIRAFKNWHGFQ